MKHNSRITSFLLVLQLMFHGTAFTQQWQYLGLGTESIETIAVDWSNSNVIYAGAFMGGLFKSTNGGITWDTLLSDVNARNIVFDPQDPKVIYATLGISVPSVVKSIDGGTNWIKADSGIQVGFGVGASALAVDPDHPDTLYVGTSGGGGAAGNLYRSTDGGRSWSVPGDITTLWSGVTALAIRPDSTNVVYAADGNSDLLKSTDYGTSWSLVLQGSFGLCETIQFDTKNPSTFYLGTSWAAPDHTVGIFKTTDGGLTWEYPTAGLPDTLNVYSIQIYSDSATEQLFLTGRGQREGGIFESANGEPWKFINSDGRFQALTLFGKRLYAGGVGVYAMDVPTSVSTDSRPPVQTFNLDNNSPNPFNPSTNITYEIGERTMVSLDIFDMLGRKVKTLVHGKQEAGVHMAKFDGSGLSSGVYFCRLEADGSVATKKLVLVR